MIIGVPREVKNNENRVALTPNNVAVYINAGHKVLIEKNAGRESGFTDNDYINAGATIVQDPQNAWDVDMVIKVKEPIESEYKFFKEGLILYTYLHLAPVPNLTQSLLENGVIAIAYETIQLENGSLPLLTPMSEVAGRMSVQIGAQFLENSKGGKGILLGGVPGVAPAEVVIIGGGVVGTNAAKMALGLGASVTILDISADRLRQLDDQFNGQLKTIISNPQTVRLAVKSADLLIGAVLVPGARAPQIVTEDMVKDMRAGSVIVDVAVDQGGSIETIDHITTHADPTYVRHNVVHYAVANMPGAVSRTSTIALTNVTTQFGLEIANKGYEKAALDNPALAKGINVMNGKVTLEGVADAHGYTYTNIYEALENKEYATTS
ncbi:alanine dehydrogenase [Pseudalkalibacillus salsuginis]|uniref:alanine dehydrogenase n=1 Tax=Pseudalkalibacillus salsuginis TaxID=2910972 RepID=UPI001F0052E3|nr:alanine dehydrogenase [Pseudalkalibacillus salsuginis]MCF6409524.1 alanine dehydrogenase [Pseudalkalibacillus salsuginis]